MADRNFLRFKALSSLVDFGSSVLQPPFFNEVPPLTGLWTAALSPPSSDRAGDPVQARVDSTLSAGCVLPSACGVAAWSAGVCAVVEEEEEECQIFLFRAAWMIRATLRLAKAFSFHLPRRLPLYPVSFHSTHGLSPNISRGNKRFCRIQHPPS